MVILIVNVNNITNILLLLVVNLYLLFVQEMNLWQDKINNVYQVLNVQIIVGNRLMILKKLVIVLNYTLITLLLMLVSSMILNVKLMKFLGEIKSVFSRQFVKMMLLKK